MRSDRYWSQLTPEDMESFRLRAELERSTNRLEPGDVYVAFLDSDWTPDNSINYNEKTRCCCGITMMAIRKLGSHEWLPTSPEVMSGLDLSPLYIQGFMFGWDWPYTHDDGVLSNLSRAYRDGQKDGQASWRLCAKNWRMFNGTTPRSTDASCHLSPPTRPASTS